jgi:hypothetical protein
MESHLQNGRRQGLIVIPGRREAASPESITTDIAEKSQEYFLAEP